MDIGSYKHKLMLDIIGNEKIVKAIDSRLDEYNPEIPDSLIGLNIFPSLQIPNLVNNTETYILMSCSVMGRNSNRAYADIELIIRVLAHQNRLTMEGESSNRIDFISNELTKLLDDSLKYGMGVLTLCQNREIILNERYTYRHLVFKTSDMVRRPCEIAASR